MVPQMERYLRHSLARARPSCEEMLALVGCPHRRLLLLASPLRAWFDRACKASESTDWPIASLPLH